jgi:hypothetical protein
MNTDINSDVMSAIPNRMWWKPWRWKVEVFYWDNAKGYRRDTSHDCTVRNLTKKGAIGVMKLHGIKHQDFEE